MVVPKSAYPSVIQFEIEINNYGENYRYSVFERSSTNQTYRTIITSTWS